MWRARQQRAVSSLLNVCRAGEHDRVCDHNRNRQTLCIYQRVSRRIRAHQLDLPACRAMWTASSIIRLDARPAKYLRALPHLPGSHGRKDDHRDHDGLPHPS
jgi:hypothetical protein